MKVTTEKIDLKNLDKSDWQTFRFDKIAQKISERVDPNETALDTYIGLTHIDGEDIHIRRTGTSNDVKGTKLRFYPGDVIFGRRRAYQRKAAIATTHGFCSAHALVLRANQDVIDPKLFPFFLHSDQFMHRAVDISVGSLSPTINWGKLKVQEFQIPPKEKQIAFKELLLTHDRSLEKFWNLFNKINTSYLSCIENQLLDKSAKKIKLGSLGNVIRGVGYKPDQLKDHYDNKSCILLRSNNILNGNINYEEIKILPERNVKNGQFLRKRDFAVCMSNGSKDLVGKAANYDGSDKNVTVGSFCAIFRPNDLQSYRLVKHLFSSESYRTIIKRTLTGSAINNLKPDDIENLFFRVNINTSNYSEVLDKLDLLDTVGSKTKFKIDPLKMFQKKIINQIF